MINPQSTNQILPVEPWHLAQRAPHGSGNLVTKEIWHPSFTAKFPSPAWPDWGWALLPPLPLPCHQIGARQCPLPLMWLDLGWATLHPSPSRQIWQATPAGLGPPARASLWITHLACGAKRLSTTGINSPGDMDWNKVFQRMSTLRSCLLPRLLTHLAFDSYWLIIRSTPGTWNHTKGSLHQEECCSQ